MILWTGPRITFINTGTNDPAQDFLTDKVILDRRLAGPIFNAVVETGGRGSGPAGIRWAVGSIEDGIENLNFLANGEVDPGDGSSFLSNVCQGACGDVLPSSTPFVAHLIEDDIYIDFTFTAWGGRGNAGLFSYIRSTPEGTVVDNTAPVALNDSFTLDQDTVLSDDVSTNDSDLEGDATYALDVGVTNGVLTFNADGSFSYEPNAGFFGTDSFTYTISDAEFSNAATVEITVTNVVDDTSPVAVNDSFTISENTLLIGNVSTNDINIAGDVTYALGNGTTNGSLTFNTDGSFIYTPAANFNGLDSFTYTISDGEISDTATVNLTVSSNNLIVNGTRKSERIEGGTANDILRGRQGNDILIGGDGDDLLIGGRGRDKYEGGAGNDTFRFKRRDLKDKPDVIFDFEVGADLLDVSGVFKGGRFRSDNPLNDFVTISGSSKRTVVRIDFDGVGDRQQLNLLVVLEGVDANTVDGDSFIV